MKHRNRKHSYGFIVNVIIGIVLAAFLHGSALARVTYFGFGSQSQARLMCERFGLQLVKDDSEEKHGHIVEVTIDHRQAYWIDATVSSDIAIVKTSDDVELTYKPFVENHIPSANSCIAIWKENWESRPCNRYSYPICENAGSAELVLMHGWNKTKAVELCEQFDLGLLRIRDEAGYYDTLNVLNTAGIDLCGLIDVSINITSGELKTNYESVLTQSTARFDVYYSDGGSCILLCWDGVFESTTCASKQHVLCEEIDDGKNNVTINVTILNSTESTKISQRLNDIGIDILKPFEVNFTLDMTVQWVAGLFTKIQNVLDDILLDVSENVNIEIQRHVTKILTTVVDNVTNFTLSKMTTGGAAVALKTPSLELHLEKNTIETLTNCTYLVGPHTGFKIPSAEHIFPHLSHNVTLNRVIFRLGPEWHQIFNTSDQFTTDILSLSFSSEDGQEIKVQNSTQDIEVRLGNLQTPLNETFVMGQYVKADAVTHYVFQIRAFKPFQAIQIMLATSSPVFENTTAYMSTEFPRNLSVRSDFQSSSDVIIFNGSFASIFLPEEKVTKAGSFYVTFDLVYSHGVEFRVSTTQHRCSYSGDNKYNWQNDGCKVSPKSNVNSTLCLCNHLTTFTAA